METPTIRIEDHSLERVVSFDVACRGPEEAAWNLLRSWVTENVADYTMRRYIGCAPEGHHPRGEGHLPGEEPGIHAYTAQMLLLADEASGDTYKGAGVRAAPQGLFLVGQVALDVPIADGPVDIGASMEKSFGVLSAWLKDSSGYDFDFKDRPYFEEHVFSPGWFRGVGELVGFKLWLPIRKTAPSS